MRYINVQLLKRCSERQWLFKYTSQDIWFGNSFETKQSIIQNKLFCAYILEIISYSPKCSAFNFKKTNKTWSNAEEV